MAAPTTTLEIKASAKIAQATVSGSAGTNVRQLLAERLLSHGVVVGQHVQDAGYYVATVAAGAPGTTDVDLIASLVRPSGGALVPVVGKLVYLEVVRLTGSDTQVRKSAANAITLTSGVTDTLNVAGGHAVLFDALPSTSTRPTSGLDYDATHKQLQLESTGGCTVAILAAVV